MRIVLFPNTQFVGVSLIMLSSTCQGDAITFFSIPRHFSFSSGYSPCFAIFSTASSKINSLKSACWSEGSNPTDL